VKIFFIRRDSPSGSRQDQRTGRASIFDAEGIYRSRAWWTNVEKEGEESNKSVRAKRTEVNNSGEGVVGAMRRPQSTVVP